MLREKLQNLLLVPGIEPHVAHDMRRRTRRSDIPENFSFSDFASAFEHAAFFRVDEETLPFLRRGRSLLVSVNEQEILIHVIAERLNSPQPESFVGGGA